MAKTKTTFFCQNCGTQHSKWVGQCGVCKEWNTIVEEVIQKEEKRIWKQSRTAKQIVNKPLKNKYALLLGFTKRILDDECHNIPEAVAISIEDTIPIANIDSEFSNSDLTNIPSAPAYICEPSAPPIEANNITRL